MLGYVGKVMTLPVGEGGLAKAVLLLREEYQNIYYQLAAGSTSL